MLKYKIEFDAEVERMLKYDITHLSSEEIMQENKSNKASTTLDLKIEMQPQQNNDTNEGKKEKHKKSKKDRHEKREGNEKKDRHEKKHGNEKKDRKDNIEDTQNPNAKPEESETLPKPVKKRLRESIVYDPRTRNVSLKISLGVLILMLLATLVLNMAVYFSPILFNFFLSEGIWCVLAGSIGLLILSLSVFFSECARLVPKVVVPLGVLFMSMITAYGTVYLEKSMLLAISAIIAMVAACGRMARSSWDFTEFSTHIIAGLAVYGFLTFLVSCTVFTVRFMKLELILLFTFTMVYSFIKIMAIQQVLKGNSLHIEEEEYGIFAYVIYTPIITLILSLCKKRR